MHQVCFTETLTWLLYDCNMAFRCHAHFLILALLVALPRAAHHTDKQPLAHCITSRIAVKSSHKIYFVLVSFNDSRVYLCNPVENYGFPFQLM